MPRFKVDTVYRAIDRYSAPVRKMQNRVHRFTRTAERGLGRVNRSLNKVGRGMRTVTGSAVRFATLGIGAVSAALFGVMSQFSKIENAQAAFTPLMGGAVKAEKLVARLTKTAATTPFQFNNLAKTAKQLLPVMQGDINRTINTIRMLGDTAGGNAQKLDSITRGFTKAMLKGKVDMESLNMIAEAGVPIFTELAKSMGVKPGKSFFKMISAGDVTTRHLTKAFERMTKKRGIFFKGMEIASKTLSGMFSTLRDNISLTAASIGSVLAPTVKGYVDRAITAAGAVREWVKANQDLLKAGFLRFLKVAREELGTFFDGFKKAPDVEQVLRTVLRISIKLMRVIGFIGRHKKTILTTIAVVAALVVGLKVLAGVIFLVNLAFSMNPIALVTLAIVALIAAVVFLAKKFRWFRTTLKVVGFAFLALMGPIGWLIGASILIVKNWKPIKKFFLGIFEAIGAATVKVSKKIAEMIGLLRKAITRVKDFSGFSAVVGFARGIFGGDDAEAGAPGDTVTPVAIGPQERVARSIDERIRRNFVELTIKDDTGRAEITGGNALDLGLVLKPSGDF